MTGRRYRSGYGDHGPHRHNADNTRCPDCNGSGDTRDGRVCRTCDGDGTVFALALHLGLLRQRREGKR